MKGHDYRSSHSLRCMVPCLVDRYSRKSWNRFPSYLPTSKGFTIINRLSQCPRNRKSCFYRTRVGRSWKLELSTIQCIFPTNCYGILWGGAYSSWFHSTKIIFEGFFENSHYLQRVNRRKVPGKSEKSRKGQIQHLPPRGFAPRARVLPRTDLLWWFRPCRKVPFRLIEHVVKRYCQTAYRIFAFCLRGDHAARCIVLSLVAEVVDVRLLGLS